MKNVKNIETPARQSNNQPPRSTMESNKRNLINASVGLLKGFLQKKLENEFEQSLNDQLEQIKLQIFDGKGSKKLDDALTDIKVFQKKSQQVSSRYIEEVVKNISGFSNGGNVNVPRGLIATIEVKDWSSLQLVETDDIENQLLLDEYISTCTSDLSDVLYALRHRVGFLMSVKELKASENPFGPAVLLNTFTDLMSTELFSKKGFEIINRSFSQAVLSNLGDVLKEVNELFIKANIMPKLPKHKIANHGSLNIKDTQSLTHADTKSSMIGQTQMPEIQGGHVGVASLTSMGIDPVIYADLIKMAQLHRSLQGENFVSDGLTVSGSQLPTTKLIEVLTSLQKEGAREEVDLSESVRLQVGEKIQVDGQRQPYAEQDDTLIDVVAMFFDVILQDRQLPDTVRAMIAQLQIPILKVAMIDKDFFAKKSHPARQFLNAMSQAGLGVSGNNQQIKSSIFEKMEELVMRVLMEFDNDVGIFVGLCDELGVFMEQQQRQVDLLEERSRKATKSSEQLELTKRQAAYEIALRINGKSIPEFVQIFLDETWKDVLVLALLRKEREPQESQQCIDVIDRLVVSVVEPVDYEAKELIINSLARLLKDIKVGLENISCDFHQSATFFKELESWHKQLLAMGQGEPSDVASVEKVVMVELNEEMYASLEEDLLQELEGKKAQMPNDKFSKLASKIDVGDWVEYTGEDGGVLRATLSWKSSVTMQCLFVNDCGVKAMDISLDDLAEAFRQKRMTIIGQERAPLVDRVLAGMKSLMTSKSAEPGLA